MLNPLKCTFTLLFLYLDITLSIASTADSSQTFEFEKSIYTVWAFVEKSKLSTNCRVDAKNNWPFTLYLMISFVTSLSSLIWDTLAKKKIALNIIWGKCW